MVGQSFQKITRLTFEFSTKGTQRRVSNRPRFSCLYPREIDGRDAHSLCEIHCAYPSIGHHAVEAGNDDQDCSFRSEVHDCCTTPFQIRNRPSEWTSCLEVMRKYEPMRASPTTQKRLGLKIKDLREERDLTQYACAPVLGLSRTYLADVECGRRNVSLATLAGIAEGFGITLEELLRGV